MWQARRAGGWVALQRKVGVRRHSYSRRGMPYRNPICCDLTKPATLEPALQLGSSGVACEQYASVRIGGAQRQYLPSMGIGSTLLGKQVVAIVPERHQTKIMNRRVRGSAIPDHHMHVAAQRCQEGPVSRRWARFGDQHGEPSRTKNLPTGFAEPIKISLVGHDDHRAPLAVRARTCSGRKPERPLTARVRARRYLP
jgi:hypothetical protein